jgi:CRISPR-associated endonuclease/helicase Cas3
VWGKSRAGDRHAGDPFHPAVLHMLDVGAVALMMLDEILPRTLIDLLLSPCREPRRLSSRQAALLVASHDLGKISPGFQAKVPELAARLREAGLTFPANAEPDHGFVTACNLPGYLAQVGAGARAAEVVARTVAAHHGTLHGDGATRARERAQGDGTWEELRRVAFETLARTLQVADLSILEDASSEWLVAFAGFTAVSDWIGSSSYFAYQCQADPTLEYLQESLRTARRALDQIGWRSWRPPISTEFGTLFPGLEARGIQRTIARELGDLDRGTMLLIEAPTGCGKTEAALQAALAMASRGGLGGIYYALPTQATSNQMFGRVRRFLDEVSRGEPVQLHLLHGLADLEPGYRTLFAPELQPRGIYDEDVDCRDARSMVADEWFRAKKRGLLSSFAVGTVDQALLATLEARHFFVRLFGLAGKVLIVDEVHAYDTYMSRIHIELLRWLRMTGASVVLLSATLPADRRDALLQAWTGRPEPSERIAYPRIAIARTGEPPQVQPGEPVEPRAIRLLEVPHDPEAVAKELATRLHSGGCAAWICNTVGRAQEAYRALRRHFEPRNELLAFHARFPVDERGERERRLQELFGPGSSRPPRFVVAATQVIEQSLDLDFDLLVTDLAPIDLLIQRVGRLHRHPDRIPPRSRPRGLGEPLFLCAMKELAPTFDGLQRDSRPYHAHVVLRTRLALAGKETLRLPTESDDLLEAVYGPCGEPPEDLRSLWESSAADLERTRADADRRAGLPLFAYSEDVRKLIRNGTDAREEDDPAVHASLQARTRDIEASTTVLCVFAQGEELSLDPEATSRVSLDRVPDPDSQRRMLLRAISISNPGWAKFLARRESPAAWSRIAQLRHVKVLVLGPTGEWSEDPEVRLDPELGLVLPRRTGTGGR